MTTAEQLAAAVVAVTDPAEMALIEAAMGPVDERNRPLVPALLALLDAANSLAMAIADNANESRQRIPGQAMLTADVALFNIVRRLEDASLNCGVIDSASTLFQGHRLPTNLDAHA